MTDSSPREDAAPDDAAKGPAAEAVDAHEEERMVSGLWSWGLVILFTIVVVAWGIFTFRIVPESPRKWDFGQLPDVPGQSIYSSVRTPDNKTPATQIAPLPEAKPPTRTEE